MKEDDLINKLENVELPEVELPSHKSQLKMALLKSGHSDNVLETPGIKKRIITMKSIFMSKQPVWRTALVSVIAIALIAGLSITLPSLFGKSDEALAADIALNSPEVQAALEGREIRELEVLDIVYSENSDIATVILQLEYNFLIAADVDMETEQVIETHLLELTDKKKQEIIDMAEADPRVQDLLEQGAHVYDFEMGYYTDFLAWGINPSGVVLFPHPDGNVEVLTKFLLIIRMALENNEYWVVLDPILGNVFDVIDVTEAKQRMEEESIILITITTPTPTNQQPIEIVSVGRLPPINPGGPLVEITLKNVSAEPIASLTVTLELQRDFTFEFDVTSSNPLLPTESISTKRTLIGPGAGIGDSSSYPLTLEGTMQNGATFAYTKQVQIMDSSSGHPKGMESLRWLTDAEKDRVIEIALNTPEALALLETETYYEASVRWVAINWLNDHAAALWELDYEEADGGVPEGVPESWELYSQVEIYIAGATYYPMYLLRVAINPDTGEVAHVEVHGLKKIPAP